MNEIINDATSSLNTLIEKIKNLDPTNQNLTNTKGWHHPPLNVEELTNIPLNIINKMQHIDSSQLSDIESNAIKSIPEKINIIETKSLPYFMNGHGHQAIPAFLTTMSWINTIIDPIISLSLLGSENAYPENLKRRLAILEQDLRELTIDKTELESKIKKINDAYDAANTLPTTISNLYKAEKTLKNLHDKSIVSNSEIEKLKDKSINESSQIDTHLKKANSLIDRCEDAYKVNTSQGLAKAFEDKAKSLSKSIYMWEAGLIIALVTGSYIGAQTYNELATYISSNPQALNTTVLIIKFLISLISFGAPIWFAWLATKQISERFKLSEDYAFKASVAKAYEGYRKEASRIDPVLEARLFSTALSRLEQEPLRFVDGNNHGSPWQELISSNEFQNALNNLPDLKNKFIELANKGIDKVELKSVFKKKES